MAKRSSKRRTQREVLSKLHEDGALADATAVHIAMSAPSKVDTKAIGSNGHVSTATVAHGTDEQEKMPSYGEKQVMLADGSQVVVEHENEIMFVGPGGVRMVVNCLPLFHVPRRDEMIASQNRNGQEEPARVEQEEPARVEQEEMEVDEARLANGDRAEWTHFSTSHEAHNGTSDASQGTVDDSVSNPLPPSLTSSLIIPSDANPFEDNFTPKPEDIFSTVDPFTIPTSATIADKEDLLFSSRDQAFQEAYLMAAGDSDENLDVHDIAVEYVDDIRPLKARCGSVSFVSKSVLPLRKEATEKESIATANDRHMTPLPPPPPTQLPRYVERGGWAMKLSHRKGVFGDRWQRRYFVLNGSTLSYFKKYGDSHPKGVIKLIPGSWCMPVAQGTPRRPDAMAQPNPGFISVMRCFAVHRPPNHAASLSGLLATEGIAEAFRSHSLAVSNAENCSRTFYIVAPSNQERDAWIEAIQHNLQAYQRSPEALDVACRELKCMLHAVGSDLPASSVPSILLLLHQKKDDIMHRTASYCQSHHFH